MTAQLHPAQPDLYGHRPIRFDGWLYREALDRDRLTSQLRRVCYALLDGQWWTLPALTLALGMPPSATTGVSARLRDLRKPRFGGFTVLQRRRPGAERSGVWEYRLDNVQRAQVEVVFGPAADQQRVAA